MKTAKPVLTVALLAFGLACGGYSSSSHPTTPAVAGTMPTIAALAPAEMTSGGAAFVLTVNGSHFNANAVINFAAAAQTTTFVSSGQLAATIPATNIATPGTATVTVTNPGTPGGIYGGGTQAETSNSVTFTIN